MILSPFRESNLWRITFIILLLCVVFVYLPLAAQPNYKNDEPLILDGKGTPVGLPTEVATPRATASPGPAPTPIKLAKERLEKMEMD